MSTAAHRGLIGLLTIIAVGYFLFPSAAPTHSRLYYFHIPQTLLQCVNYAPRSGETFEGFQIEQPMTLDVRSTHDVRIVGNYFIFPAWGCAW